MPLNLSLGLQSIVNTTQIIEICFMSLEKKALNLLQTPKV